MMELLSRERIAENAKKLLKRIEPPPAETVSEWADAFRYTQEGKYYVSFAEYQRAPMDAISDPFVEEVVLVWSVQTGKTETILNTIGRFVHREPSNIMWVLPSLEMAGNVSKERLEADLIDCTPELQGLFADKRTRDANNALRFKKFPGGFIILPGANSPASLSSWPIKVLVGDEIDRWGKLIRGEGDILSLARKRTVKYSDRKIVLVSSPTTKASSRIWPAYLETNQQHYHVPCPLCGGEQMLKFPNLKFEYDRAAIAELTLEEDEEDFEYRKKAIARHIHAWFRCEHCGGKIEHEHKQEMVCNGRWVAKYPKIHERQGFHMWQAYSPFVTWAETAAEFLHADGYPDRLQVFVNTVLGELYEEKGDRIHEHPLMERREQYPGRLPAKLELITAGVDVQGDRLECEIIGWAADGENWSLGYHVLWGNTQLRSTYGQLEEIFDMTWIREDDAMLSVDALGIDTGFNPVEKKNTEGVDSHIIYDYVEEASKLNRVFALKGSSSRVEGVVKKTRAGSRRLTLWMLDGEQIKDIVLKRLSIEPGKPGSAHFPLDYDRAYFKMLTAEEKRTRGDRKQWVKIRERNEAVDTRQYAYAVMLILKPRWGNIKRSVAKTEPEREMPVQEPDFPNKKRKLKVKKRKKLRGRL
ncbi:hypothetical protein CR161_03820 [Prosthecochloris sp. ZM]|uniref:phage terminase large subunit family protein n=1 Tax=Prosthecochloris sp. ZM TaxID=2283143 RepID=UPI000DF786DA|nr:terminase gpA endonuclease subunit [Prosthecochloris sp. ZM]RDD29905.1 hypothetical protein CR161_03820 [Prosthecochloris sp. ZM]